MISRAKRSLLAGLLAACAAACAASDGARPRAGGDLLTDLRDDGSLLTGALGNEVETRELAVHALANLPPVEGAELLVDRAEIERDPEVLTGFCYLFGRWRHAPALPLLESLTADGRSAVRAAAYDALGRYADDTHTERLLVGLDDDAPAVRVAAAEALARVDAARSDHRRTASEATLLTRDTVLAEAALRDPDPRVRERAVWALGRVRPRGGHATVFRQAANDRAPLVRLFALRGLARDAADPSPLLAALDDPDPRVALEAAAGLARAAPRAALERRLAHPRPVVRQLAAAGLAADDAPLADATALALQRLAREDPSPWVAREARAALARREGPVAAAAREELRASEAPRDRERLARLLADGALRDPRLLDELLADPAPVVRAAAVAALRHAEPLEHRDALLAALASDDVAVRGSAATAVEPLVRSGRAPPWLVTAVADALTSAEGFAMDEARVALAGALELPAVDPTPPSFDPAGTLLERLAAEQAAARADRFVRVALETDRGRLVLELDRLLAPRSVGSFLERAAAGFYDGLDVHRVVPNFVAQGLDPRGDGWGTGGVRLPDEFRPVDVAAGTVGVPRTDARHTNGCQLFLTHVPAPHLTGEYTVLGRVAEGMDVLAELQVGDLIRRVERLADG